LTAEELEDRMAPVLVVIAEQKPDDSL